MLKTRLKQIIPVCVMILFSCQSPLPKENIDKDKTYTAQKEVVKESTAILKIQDDVKASIAISVDSLANRLVKNLTHGKNLSFFFVEEWTLVYHDDNRCEGSTDGQINHLNKLDIDKTIKLSVKNDGEGWVCEKTAAKIYDLSFNLKEKVKSWDRFQIANYKRKEKNVIYLIGKGESDYLKLYYNASHLIIKLEYRSEDPG